MEDQILLTKTKEKTLQSNSTKLEKTENGTWQANDSLKMEKIFREEESQRLPVMQTAIQNDEKLSAESLLCKLRQWPPGFQGFEIEKDEIIIHVQRGNCHAEETRKYLNDNICGHEGQIKLNNFKFKETNLPLRYCVARGAEIVEVSADKCIELQAMMPLSNIEEFKSYHGDFYFGSVGCIASSRVNDKVKRYLITARHNFIPYNLLQSDKVIDIQGSGLGNYFCQNVESFQRISWSFQGKFGQHDSKGVDVAMLPLTTEHIATPWRMPIFNGNIIDLMGIEVEMIGARLGRIRGQVVDISFRPKIGSGPVTECIGVISIEQRQYLFSEKGDSGATVVRRNAEGNIEEVIGLISKRGLKTIKSEHGDDRECTWVVLLRNCFKAIQDEFGVELFLDNTWKKCSTQVV